MLKIKKVVLQLITTDDDCSVESLRKTYHLSRETATRLNGRIGYFIQHYTICLLHCPYRHNVSWDYFSRAVHNEKEYLGIRDKAYNFMRDVTATREHVRHLRVCAIIALRRAGLHKDVAAYFVKVCTDFWDDMDPIEGIRLLSEKELKKKIK